MTSHHLLFFCIGSWNIRKTVCFPFFPTHCRGTWEIKEQRGPQITWFWKRKGNILLKRLFNRIFDNRKQFLWTAAGLAQLGEHLTAERRSWVRFRGRTNTQGLKITEKWGYFLCPANAWTFVWLGWPLEMADQSPVGDLKIVSPISTFVLNILTLKESAFFLVKSSLD